MVASCGCGRTRPWGSPGMAGSVSFASPDDYKRCLDREPEPDAEENPEDAGSL
jgi:hypothetical protein